MLAMIGEQFTHNDEITGAVISVRKGVDRIAIWTNSCDGSKVSKIGYL